MKANSRNESIPLLGAPFEFCKLSLPASGRGAAQLLNAAPGATISSLRISISPVPFASKRNQAGEINRPYTSAACGASKHNRLPVQFLPGLLKIQNCPAEALGDCGRDARAAEAHAGLGQLVPMQLPKLRLLATLDYAEAEIIVVFLEQPIAAELQLFRRQVVGSVSGDLIQPATHAVVHPHGVLGRR